MTIKYIPIFLFALFLLSCGDEVVDPVIIPPETTSPNILLVIADDMGLDASPGYDIGSVKPNMPNLEELMDTGIRFTNLWSYPTCTPTRSSILTGKFGFRTGITKVGDVLSTAETSIQSYLDDNTGNAYSHAVIGKWHLSTEASHPTTLGVGYYAGLLTGGVQSYTQWNLTENGQTNTSTEYTTTKFTDLAIDWVQDQTQPWFLWLAYNAPHTPFHLPPDDLHSQGALATDQASIDANPLPYYLAMLEALDTEMGRLLNSLSQDERDNTVIIFIGDNGTPNQVAQEYNSRRVKGTVYQGGVNVPMIVAGKEVSRGGQTEDALITTTDLFVTIANIAGSTSTNIEDSQSFFELLTSAGEGRRAYAFTESGKDTGGEDIAIRNATHKYILFADGQEALYNLGNNPLENPNLLSVDQLPLSVGDSLIKVELVGEIGEIRG